MTEEQTSKTMQLIENFIEEYFYGENINIYQHKDFPENNTVEVVFDGEILFAGAIDEAFESLQNKKFN